MNNIRNNIVISILMSSLVLSGCGRDNHTSTQKKTSNQIDIDAENEITAYTDTQTSTESKETIETGEEKSENTDVTQETFTGDIMQIEDHTDIGEFAILKSAKDESLDLIGSSWYYDLQLDNNSDDKILITSVDVVVKSYQSVNHDDYVIYMAGAGDLFDPIKNIYAEIGTQSDQNKSSYPISYSAYPCTTIEGNEVDTVNNDPVMSEEVEANDGLPIRLFIQLNSTGVYACAVNINYEYHDQNYTYSYDLPKFLYDDMDDESYERAFREYEEHQDEYNGPQVFWD